MSCRRRRAPRRGGGRGRRRSCSCTGSGSRASSGTGSCDALGTAHTLVRVDLRGAGRSREVERTELSLDALGGRPRSRCSTASGSSGRRSSGTRSARRSRSSSRSSVPTLSGALVLIGGEADLSNLGAAHARLGGADREHGPRDVDRRVLVEEPAVRRSRRSRATARSSTSTASLLLENDPADYVRQCRAIAAAEPLSGRLGEVGHPVLVVVGGLDDRTLPEHGRELAARAPERAARRAAGGRALDPARGAGRRRRTRSRSSCASATPRPRPRDGGPASCAPTRRRATRGRARSATSTFAGSSARTPARR